MAPRLSKKPRRASTRKSAKKAKILADDDTAIPDPEEQKHMVKLEAHNDLYHRDIECAKGLKGEISTFDEKTGKHVQTITLVSDKPFSLEAKETKFGKDKGNHYIKIDPEPTEEETFPFLKLPPEIRNMIYSHVLERPGFTIGIEGKWAQKIKLYWRDGNGRWYHANDPKCRYNSSLMRVSKQIHDETASYLFGRHSFEFTDTTMLERFLEQIGPERAQSLINIKVLRHYRTSQGKAYRLLKAATSLKNVELQCLHIWSSYGADANVLTTRHARLLFPVVQAFIEAGREREEALSIFKVTRGLRGECAVHGSFVYGGLKECVRMKKAYDRVNQELAEEMEELIAESEEKKEKKKKKKVVKGDAKSRAGRKRKAVDYAEDSEDDDDYTVDGN